MKNMCETLKYIVKGLLKYPMLFFLISIGFFLACFSKLFNIPSLIMGLYLFALIVITAICAVILLTDDNGKAYIKKITFFSLFWFASCLVLVDFSEISWVLFFKIIVSYLFVFLGCLVPDFASKVEKEKKNE